VSAIFHNTIFPPPRPSLLARSPALPTPAEHRWTPWNDRRDATGRPRAWHDGSWSRRNTYPDYRVPSVFLPEAHMAQSRQGIGSTCSRLSGAAVSAPDNRCLTRQTQGKMTTRVQQFPEETRGIVAGPPPRIWEWHDAMMTIPRSKGLDDIVCCLGRVGYDRTALSSFPIAASKVHARHPESSRKAPYTSDT
jgi:hypothetical protein